MDHSVELQLIDVFMQVFPHVVDFKALASLGFELHIHLAVWVVPDEDIAEPGSGVFNSTSYSEIRLSNKVTFEFLIPLFHALSHFHFEVFSNLSPIDDLMLVPLDEEAPG